MPKASGPASADSDALAASWRQQSPLRPDITFLNPGTLGSTLRVASRRAQALRRGWMAEGAGAALDIDGADGYQRMRRGTDAVRAELGRWLDVDQRQVALTGNATDGIHHALLSVPWRAGDRLITSDHEHEALRNALARLGPRMGVSVDTVAFPAVDGDATIGERIAALVGPETRMVAISHVSHRSGVTLDVAAVARALAGHDVWLLVDGAHAAGTRWPVVASGVDFYAFPGHKWLFGPVGTGVLVVSARALAGTEPLLAGAPSLDGEGREYNGLDGAWRYEAGTRDWAAVAGLGAAVTFRRRWPEAALLDHYGTLTAAFVAGLGGRWHTDGAGPLIRLAMPSEQAWDIGRALWRRHRVIVKPTPDGIRVSLGPWLTAAEARRSAVLLAQA